VVAEVGGSAGDGGATASPSDKVRIRISYYHYGGGDAAGPKGWMAPEKEEMARRP
jgi:hypothetical protein